MNILLTSLMVPGAPSGVRVHYERLAEQLQREGHTVTVITQASLRPMVRRAIGVFRRALGLFGQSGTRIGIELGFVAEIYFAIDRTARYDVVNAQDVSSGWAARLALRDQAPVIVTGHFNDHPAEELVHQLHLSGLSARFLHRWYTFLLRKTQFFIGVSDYVLQRTLPWLPADAQSTVVYNGVDMTPPAEPTLPASVPDLRAMFPNRTIVLNVGQLEPRKNQRYLVQVAAALRQQYTDFVLVLVGKGEDEEHLRQQIAAAGLEQHVVLLGYHREIMALLRTANLYVHAATRENCPLVLLEAMATECPAVALAVGGIPELLAPTPEALIPVATPPVELADYLQELLTTPTRVEQLRQRQHAFGRTHFDAHVMLANTLAFFEQARQLPAPTPTHPARVPTPARPQPAMQAR
ncbi:glycosyltransferase family 4 protein [Hymenobacter aerilatus]|uniref:Glycosyltransferase family 4 protein n=1 Tax=Hymenobacter aerilatus TaxID=2932251 RepID=A0A8T9SNH0_9BACT|nr:glycosyltransferase family 4 protein [Hymenobacter aerilatus]UOR03668.1 glycosyltransferase family 4 protein [Hymenobacter aerilatus]